ncbi:transcriptional activator, TenA family [Gloeothece citriformis PCC 7424]|uniref:Transcriptional activator, TenA family n=1 Tax=Gloeothece citriformis (strain PCC 7424) TaxID=65393 RepID=B7KIQ5_GLOC7|nr:TenA family protein [Gloeothece citriformis]ACK69461.1 transcriptional activator, TenA family [Gloeothece citriformis PCC 7424]
MLSQQLWKDNYSLVQACLNHPFVQGIATGNLPPENFAFYVGQDAFFLESFARAYSIAAAKTPDWEGFSTFHQLGNGVLEELRLHETYARQWGVNLKTIQPAPATRRYTDFLLATAWSQDVGVIAVAMSPCMRLYAFLGQQLAKNDIPPHHPYRNWIETYSSPLFENLAQEIEALSDRYANLTEPVKSTYSYALFCEQEFFTSALIIES